jgi:hypothetical protein
MLSAGTCPSADALGRLHLEEVGNASQQALWLALRSVDEDEEAVSAAEAIALGSLCIVCGRTKSYDELLSHATRLLQLEPGCELACRSQAIALMALGKHGEAVPALLRWKRAVARLPEGGDRDRCEQLANQSLERCGAKLGAQSGKYPSTPHLPFSPGVNSDDVQLADCHNILNAEVVITEKLDGGNCCIKDGQVYARTHSQPATHDSFSAVKQLVRGLPPGILQEGTELFGENMQAVHSIEYGNLQSFFYVFAVRQAGWWLPWDDVVELAGALGLPTAPILFRGTLRSPDELQALLEEKAQQPSSVGAGTNPEGFVVRRCEGFAEASFAGHIAKYVRANHIQTGDSWKRRWKKASLGPRSPTGSGAQRS